MSSKNSMLKFGNVRFAVGLKNRSKNYCNSHQNSVKQ